MKQASKGLIIFSGILYLLLGIFALNNPGQAIVYFVYYIGFTTLFSGIMGIIVYFKGEKRGGLLLLSIIDIIFGIMFFAYQSIPVFMLLGLPFFIGVWVLFRGISEIFESISKRKERQYWIFRLIWGILLIFSGIYFFNYPLISTIVVVEYFGIMFIIIGIVAIVQGIMMIFKK